MAVYDLGGTTGVIRHEAATTVNLVEPCDIKHDITYLDGFVEDNTADAFLLYHTLEHVPTLDYKQFLADLYRKLKPGGYVEIVQTDAGKLLQMVSGGGGFGDKISLRAARCCLFTPAHRLRENPFHFHWNMWDAQMMCVDFALAGFHPVEFDAGTWTFDLSDDVYWQNTQNYHGVQIPNLGVRAHKP
jgi:hypothetical protein